VEISDVAIIKCSHELRVKVVNKSNIRSKTPSRVTLTRDSINYRTRRNYLGLRKIAEDADRTQEVTAEVGVGPQGASGNEQAELWAGMGL
jgi:hypothetical protein